MTRITLSMLGLALAGLALSCNGKRTDDSATLALGGLATQASVGRTPVDDDADGAADCDEKDCDADEDGDEDGEDVAVALADVPRVVLDAARAALPGAVLTSAEIELEDGQTIYSLSGTLDGKDVEIEVTATGKVLEIERD